MRFLVPLALSVASLAQPSAQTPPPAAFEVVSIKPNTSGDRASYWRVPRAGIITIGNVTVRELIAEAFDIAFPDYLLIGGPPALLEARFDITATRPAGADPEATNRMLATLLVERFALKSHQETREMPVYALSVARADRWGPRLRPSKHDCEAYRAALRAGRQVSEPQDEAGRGWCPLGADFGAIGLQLRHAGRLSQLLVDVRNFVDRPLVDATGLQGTFEWDFELPLGDEGTVHQAFERLLGLQLEPRRAPVQVLVIDSVSAPTEN